MPSSRNRPRPNHSMARTRSLGAAFPGCKKCIDKGRLLRKKRKHAGLATITNRNATRGVVVLIKCERTHKIPSRLGRVPRVVPADILPLEIERSDFSRHRVDKLLQLARGKSILRRRQTEAFANCGRSLRRTRAEWVLRAGDKGGKTPDLRPPWLNPHPLAREHNVGR